MIMIIDYGVGNLGSVANALERLGRKYGISSNPSMLKKAEALILPGVGAAGEGMPNLKKRNLDTVMTDEVKKGKPFLGICLGMQLLFDFSEEGNVACLGILKGKVKRYKQERKIPQIGWNNVTIKQCNNKTRKLFNGIPDNSYFYFVNSYYCLPEDKSIVIGTSEYGESFTSIVAKDNIFATQFHPEKSGQVGFRLLKNFIESIS